MNKEQLKQLSEKLNIILSANKLDMFERYEKIFLEKNTQVNLISKNDEKLLFEKHIFDSLAINLLLCKKNHLRGKTLLDIGTGGGFPSVPISIFYDNLKVVALDSIGKKINAIQDIKNEIGIVNLNTVCGRVENHIEKYDYVTTRAVSSLDNILKYAIPKLNPEGLFIAYKSKKISEEIKEAEKTLKNLGVKIVETINYTLPLEEVYERNLIVFKSKK